MNRQAQAVLLFLVGGAVVKAGVTDLHLRYVKAGLRPFLIAAGALLVVAAAATLWQELRRPAGADRPAETDASSGCATGHGHGQHGPRVGWLLLLPVLGLLLVSPPALGSYAAAQSGTALSDDQAALEYPPLPDGDPVSISVLDYASRAIFDRGVSLGQRRVRLTGFVAAGPDGAPMLVRIILSCCAADGRPIKVGLDGDAPTGLAPDTWIEAVGVYTDRTATDPVNGERIPFLRVQSWREVPAPKRPYE